MGVQYPHGQDRGRVSDPGGETYDRMAPTEDTAMEEEIHLSGGGKVGGGIIANGGVYQAAAEHGCKVHCYTITDRPV